MVTAYSKHDPDQLRAVANKHQEVFQKESMVIMYTLVCVCCSQYLIYFDFGGTTLNLGKLRLD